MEVETITFNFFLSLLSVLFLNFTFYKIYARKKMISDDNLSEKKRQKNLLSFLSHGKLHFLNSMGYQPTTSSHKKGIKKKKEGNYMVAE